MAKKSCPKNQKKIYPKIREDRIRKDYKHFEKNIKNLDLEQFHMILIVQCPRSRSRLSPHLLGLQFSREVQAFKKHISR